MKFGIIGTGNITTRFIDAANYADCELVALYSRTEESGAPFAKNYNIAKVYTNFSEFAAADFTAVYIASPNYIHCEQAILLMQAGKHVLCEKPIASNAAEFAKMLQVAAASNVVLLEASKHLFTPGFTMIAEQLKNLGEIRRVLFQFNQYSSRYDSFKDGIIENAFKLELSNGALLDIGVYCVQLLVALFGVPKNIQSSCIKLHNGIDGQGLILATYDTMLAELSYSKITQAVTPSVIQGERQSLTIPAISQLTEFSLHSADQPPQKIIADTHKNNMYYEVAHFIKVIQDKSQTCQKYNEISMQSLQIMDEVRKQQGVVFPADLG
ncbi:MAG: Gfo/Idh/MocA family oxidoreductase [Defluviitaleaceae bacterium]|nr:Gfo/Idh/MocA family oxidoreductase [Defluviitaleaceae bacterium]